MRSQETLTLLVLGLLLTACAATPSPAPTPARALIGNLVWQTDGRCGYRMLRPEQWEAHDGVCRDYLLPGSLGQPDRLLLSAVNYQVMQQQIEGENSMVVEFGAFQRDTSLEGWVKIVEQMWKINNLNPTWLSTLPHAKIYSLSPAIPHHLQLIALVIDQGQPLGVVLNADGVYADLDRLRREHVRDDFVTIVGSVHATGHDPANVTPALPDN